MIRVHTIGETSIAVGDRPIRADADLLFATLLYLAVERGRRVDREALCAMLWPRENAVKRRHSLRQVLYKLRRVGVVAEADTTALTLASDQVWLDFEDAGGANGTRTSARGLPGYAPRFSKPYQIWIDALRGRIESAARRRLAREIARSRAAGAWDRVEALARACLEIDPLNEEATLALAEATALAGGKSAAVAMIDRYVREVGNTAYQVQLPASVLRRRITERFTAPPARGWLEARLVGRDDVIGRLSAALETTKTGHAATHLIWGPQGIGKSRVLEEVGRIAVLLGADVVAERANPDDVHTPGLTLVRVFQAMLNKPGAIGLQPSVLEYLRHLTAQAGSTSASENDEDALTRALVDLQRALVWESPIVATLDDAQYADALSLRIMSRARGCLGSERILWIVSSHLQTTVRCDPEESHQLRRLDPGASVELTRAFLERTGAAATDETLASIATASGGNPFLIREAAAAFVGDPSAAATRSIEALLDRRFAALSEAARDLLLGGLLLGEHATVALMLQSTSMTSTDGERGLGELEEEQILRFRDGGVVEAHGAWASRLESLFAPGRVAARRLRVAELLERAAEGKRNAAEVLLSSAMQFQQAGERGRAADLFVRSAEGLEARSLPLAASATFSRAATLSGTAGEFDVRMFQALVAASRAGLSAELWEMLERFGDRLTSSVHLSERDRAEASLIHLESRQRVGGAGESLVAMSSELVGHRALPNSERLRAALVGVRAAEFCFDRSAIARLGAQCDAISCQTDDEVRLVEQIALVRALVNKRLTEARRLAELELNRMQEARFVSQRCGALLNARVPFWFDCDLVRVERVMAAARVALKDYPSTYLAVRVEDIHAAHCIETMRLVDAHESIVAAEGLARRGEHSPQPSIVAETRCRLHVARGTDAAEAELAELIAQPRENVGLTRARAFELSTATVLTTRARNRTVVAPLVAELQGLWNLILDFCPFDYPCAALATGVGLLDGRSEGRALWRDYVQNARVASHAPSAFVNSILADLGT